ncbi:MAG: SMC family ATPase [Aggregatilineales bacterium]
MRPIELIIRNFLAYREPVKLSFEGIHVACLTGANGAGKSSLLDAITWALWGKARASDRDHLLHSGQREMFVALTFEQNGRYYQVQRLYTKSGKSGKAEVWLRCYDPDSQAWAAINEHASLREIDEEITRRVGLDYETFIHSAFLQQGKADAFATQTPARRKEILADILGLAHWEAYEASAKERAQACDSQRLHSANEIKRLEDELAQEPILRQRAENLAEALAAKRAELDQAEEAYRTLMNAADQLTAARREYALLTHNAAALKSDITQLEREDSELQQEIAHHTALIVARAEIERAEAHRKQLEIELAGLDERRRLFERLERQYRKAEAELNKAQERLRAQYEALGKQAAMLERDAEQRDALHKQHATAQAELHALEGQKAELQVLRDQLDQHRKMHAEQEANCYQIEREGKQLRSHLEMLQASESPLCPVCNAPLSAERRAALIAEYTEQIEMMREQYSQAKQSLTATQQHIATLEKRIGQSDALLKRQEADLNKKLGTLNERLKATLAAAERAAQLYAEQAALQAQLESNAFAQEARQIMATCEKEAEALNYDSEAYEAIRQQLAALQEARLRADRLEQALLRMPKLQQQSAEKQEQLAQKRARLAEVEAQLPALQERINHLVELAEQAKQHRLQRDRLRTDYDALNEEYSYLKSQLLSLAGFRERCEVLHRQIAALNAQEQLYRELQHAFGKKGVPAMLIEAAIPELELLANDLLARMTDGRMHLRFETQRHKKSSDGVIETLDLLISDELGQRNYELYSGGESFRINFALRVALSQFLARRAGAQLRTLVIDEGFGSQDAAGRERLIEAINAVQDYFDLILVVTHIEELRDAFPTHIEVRKSPGGGASLMVR